MDGLHGGLQKIGEDVGAQRIGPMHQAGSDALLTVDTFFKICERFDYQVHARVLVRVCSRARRMFVFVFVFELVFVFAFVCSGKTRQSLAALNYITRFT